MVDMNGLKSTEPSIRNISPVHVTGRADIDSTKISFHLTIDCEMILPCSRTLVDVNFPIHVETTETFLLNGSTYEMDEEGYQVNGDVIDLNPVLEELLLLEIPMQVFSESDQHEDAAPQSGKDWEVIREQEKQEVVDPRLAGLAKFFEQNNPSSND